MSYRPVFVVVLASIAALIVLIFVGQHVVSRDRQDLYDRYAKERAQEVTEAARGFAADLADLNEDFDLAVTLMERAESPQVAERELHAIATIKREYVVMDSRTSAADTIEVVAFDAPPAIADLLRTQMMKTLDQAAATPDTLQVSAALRGGDDGAAWYRVYARHSPQHRVTIAILVDTKLLLTRVKLPRDPFSRTVVLGPDGVATPSSDPKLAALVGDGSRAPWTRPEAGIGSPRIVDAAVARSVGLPAAPAVAISATVNVEHGRPWTIVVVSSTSPLDEQEQLVVHRVLVGSGLVLILLLVAAGYVIHNARRAAMLRERVRSTARLEHLTERAEKIVDHIPSGVLMVSEDGRVTGANRSFSERFAGDIIGRRLDEVFASRNVRDAALVTKLVDTALESHEPQSLHRIRCGLFAQEAWLNLHAVPLERAIADVSALLVFEDLTQLRRIEERLLHSEKLVTAGQLAAGIAHEVGTPLNVARGRVELALSHLGNEHAEASNHRVAMDQIDRVTRMIQQLLDYVRPAPEAMLPLDLAASLHAVRELLHAQATKRGVAVEVHVSKPVPPIRANPDQVQQVMINLVLNALDACGPAGHVEISATRRGKTVVLEVRDDGHGIAAEIQPQVFDPFFTTKKRGQGTGLGLWVVAQIVRTHSAEIELESAPGAGTRVRVAWPVAS